jgi:hypothetical protein
MKSQGNAVDCRRSLGDLRPDFSFDQALYVRVQLRLRLLEVEGAAGEGGLA